MHFWSTLLIITTPLVAAGFSHADCAGGPDYSDERLISAGLADTLSDPHMRQSVDLVIPEIGSIEPGRRVPYIRSRYPHCCQVTRDDSQIFFFGLIGRPIMQVSIVLEGAATSNQTPPSAGFDLYMTECGETLEKHWGDNPGKSRP